MAMKKYTPEKRQLKFWSKVAITANDDLCWEWQAGTNKRGYGKIGYVDDNNEHKDYLAHRIAWQYPNYIIPDGLLILHSCDNPKCCNPKHLFLGTHKDNSQDCKQKNRMKYPPHSYGENHHNHRLTQDTVSAIRFRYSNGELNKSKLAREYGVSFTTVDRIIRGIVWRGIE